MPVKNVYRNTEENCQCVIRMPGEALRDKLSASGICFGWDRRYPHHQQLIGKYDHLKKVLEENGIDLMDLISDIEIVPTTKSAAYGR